MFLCSQTKQFNHFFLIKCMLWLFEIRSCDGMSVSVLVCLVLNVLSPRLKYNELVTAWVTSSTGVGLSTIHRGDKWKHHDKARNGRKTHQLFGFYTHTHTFRRAIRFGDVGKNSGVELPKTWHVSNSLVHLGTVYGFFLTCSHTRLWSHQLSLC